MRPSLSRAVLPLAAGAAERAGVAAADFAGETYGDGRGAFGTGAAKGT